MGPSRDCPAHVLPCPPGKERLFWIASDGTESREPGNRGGGAMSLKVRIFSDCI